MKILSNPIYVKADIDIYNFYKDMGANVINIPEDFNGINACLYVYKEKRRIYKINTIHRYIGSRISLSPSRRYNIV